MILNDLFVKTPGLIAHSMNVLNTVKQVVDYLPPDTVTQQQVEDLLTAAMYHDIGKSVWHPEWFSLPPYKIYGEVLAAMRYHPIQSLYILDRLDIQISEGARKIILCHHERRGGKGYPNGTEPDDLTLGFSACDIFCACRETRAYREFPLTKEKALNEAARVAPDIVIDALECLYVVPSTSQWFCR